MKLCTFSIATPVGIQRRLGIVTEAGIGDASALRIACLERTLPRAAAARVGAAQVPANMLAFIASGPTATQWLAEALESVLPRGIESTSNGMRTVYRDDQIVLLAPVPRPTGIANFSVWPSHSQNAAALGITLPSVAANDEIKPYWKGNPDTVVGPNTVLECPSYADDIDVECEFGCVVGIGGRDMNVEQARCAIAGYTILNDVSARRVQALEMKTGRGPAKGKDFDTGNVMGPWLVTPDEIGDPRQLRMSLHINGQEMSACDTKSMVWDFAEMLSYMSTCQTIQPGQVISAGCYAGGSAHEVGRTLLAGDRVEMRISRIGSLINTIGGKR